MSTNSSGGTTALVILAGGVVLGGIAALVYRGVSTELLFERPRPKHARSSKQARIEKQYRHQMRRRIQSSLA